MHNRIKHLLNPPASVAGEQTEPVTLNQITLTPMQAALVSSCMFAGAALSGRATHDPAEGALLCFRAGLALQTFAKEDWQAIKAMLDGCEMGGDTAEFDGPPFPFGEDGQEPKEGWQ